MKINSKTKRKIEILYRRMVKNKKNLVIFGGLLIFVLIVIILGMKVDHLLEKAAQEKALRIEAEMKAQEEAERKKMLDEKKKSDSLQPGVPVGTFEPGEEKVIYLTFDDGPSENTKKVLDILEQYEVKATFFVTGAKENCRTYIKEAFEAGHTIGLHTYSHEFEKVYSSTDKYFKDLEAVGEIVKEQLGFVPCYIRFPGGASNTISRNYTSGIMSQLTEMTEEKGYQYYDWNWDSGDGGNLNTEEVYQNAIGCEKNEIIILFHDGPQKQSTVEALPKIIEHYKERGYEFRAVTRESFVVHHPVNN